MVVGGAYQGKLPYALERFQIEECKVTDGRCCEKEDIFQAVLIDHFHEYVKRFMAEEAYLRALPEELDKRNPEVILITNELGYGIVPMDKFDRAYREMTGRVCCLLAAKAKEVHRVICGIGTVIKDA